MTAWIAKRYQQKRKPLTVVDWGCHDGTAIGELARKTTGIARCFGFDLERSPNWRKLQHVSFLQRRQQHFPRYFKPESIDLLYTHWGLFHILRKEKEEGFARYIATIAPKLAKGGMLISTPVEHARVRVDVPKLLDMLEKELNPNGLHYLITFSNNVFKIKRAE